MRRSRVVFAVLIGANTHSVQLMKRQGSQPLDAKHQVYRARWHIGCMSHQPAKPYRGWHFGGKSRVTITGVPESSMGESSHLIDGFLERRYPPAAGIGEEQNVRQPGDDT